MPTKISQALKLWRSLLKIYSEKDIDNFMSGIRDLNKHIDLALELDESSLTAILIIDNALEAYSQSTTISLKDLTDSKSKAFDFIRKFNELKELIHDYEIEKIVNEFQAGISQELKRVGCWSEKVEDFIQSRYGLAEIRLAALKSFRDLTTYKFSSGKNDSTDFRFPMDVQQYFDINILLTAAKEDYFPNSISLALIRDIKDEFSYFVFLIKNGENIYIVCDKPDLPSIDYKNRGRSRGISRSFTDRIDAHYFPYEFMSLEFDAKEAVYKVKQFYTTAVVPAASANHIGKLSEMNPESIVWVYMLFWMFKQKFFADSAPELPQAYTGAMVNLQLSSPVSQALAKIYPSLNLEPLSSESLTNSNPEVKQVWDYKITGKNNWMEKRYTPEIKNPDPILNYIALPDTKEEYRNGKIVPARSRTDKFLDRGDLNKISFDVAGLESTEVGLPEALRQRHIYYARLNQAEAIQVLADKEFEAKRNTIREWYTDKVIANIDAIRKAIATGVFESKYSQAGGFFDRVIKTGNIFTLQTRKEFEGRWGAVHLQSTMRHNQRHCFFNGKVASYAAVFDIEDTPAIAKICGLKVGELPVYLREIWKFDKYSGNSILNNVDPLEDLKNPWKKISYDVVVWLSQSSLNAIYKEYGVKK